MNWQELLIRALVSGAAGAASTGALVMTAENAPKLRKKRKRRRRRRRPGDPPRKASRKQKRAREKRKREVDAAVADPGRMATRHLAEAAAPGMTTDEFIASLKDGGRSMRDGVGRLFGLVPPPPEPTPEARDRRGRHGQRPDRSASARRGRRPKQTRQDGLEALKQDVMYLAKDKVKQKVVEAAGVGEGVERIKDVAEEIGERAGDVGRTISEVARDGAGRLGETAGSVARNAGELASSVQKALPEDVEGVSDGVKGIGRWLQGPGAQNYDGERRRRELPTTTVKPTVVEAKMGDDDDAPSPRPADAEPSAPHKASSLSSSPFRGTPAPRAGEAAPFRPAEELSVHAPDDDERWTAVEPGRVGPSLPREAPRGAGAAPPADRPQVKPQGDAVAELVEEEPAQAAAASRQEPVVGDGPAAGEMVDAELLPAPTSADEDIVEAKIDDDAAPPVRRHRG